VKDVRGIEVTNHKAVAEALDDAELVFTAVGEPNLAKVAPTLAQAATRRTADNPLRVLCSENGLDIAKKLRHLIRDNLGGGPAGFVIVADTTMGRMCQVVSPVPKGAEPVASCLGWAVCAEPFFGIPTNARVLEGVKSAAPALQPMDDAEFDAQEDVKAWAHNGLHAFLAFLGELRGAQYFCDLDAQVRAMAAEMLRDEVGEALLRKHGRALDRNFWFNYAPTILRRITCPGLHDAVARGSRDAMRKLQPWERLVCGVRGIAQQGIDPIVYATGLAAAVLIAIEREETALTFNEVLMQHCGFDKARDARLIKLARDRRTWLGREFMR